MIFMLASCGTVVKNPVAITDPNFQAAIPEKAYKINVGDTLDIKFYHNPELNETVIVRPDGRISLQLVQDVMVSGRTPDELRKVLMEGYKSEVRKPEIVIIVRTFNNNKIYVDGEVLKPGMLPLLGEMTVLQSVASAGGFKETARLEEIIVIRKGKDGKPGALTVNMKPVIDGTDIAQDFALAPNDIVFVPRSSVANVNLWMEQYIRKNIPLPVGLGIGYYFGN